MLEGNDMQSAAEVGTSAEKSKAENNAKHTIKDSVFSDLFRITKYLLQMYRVLHPEDTKATEKDLKDITINNVMTNQLYNDLGFTVGDRLFILVECQTTWSWNIVIRFLLYLAQEYNEYFVRTRQDLYRSKKVKMPKPELYMIYTGKRGNKPDKISLSKDFFNGENIGLDLEVNVIYKSKDNNIINQYIEFTRVYDRQREKFKTTREAVLETIRICKDKDVLKEYLESRESEVVSIMMKLFDQEEVFDIYVENRVNDAVNDALNERNVVMARNMIKQGKLSPQEIADVTGLRVEDVLEIEQELLQPI